MRVYTPNALILPKELGLRRVQESYPWHQGISYDFYTLCYDVFVSLDNKKIIAVCPPFRNFYKALFPLQIFLNGVKLDYTLITPREYEKLNTIQRLEIHLPLGAGRNNTMMQDSDGEIILEFRWKILTQRCRVSPNPFRDLSQNPVNTTLVTIQKNNPLEWIQDWCLFYHRVHGVNQIVIYDNGSLNQSVLNTKLNELDPALHVQIIAWDFSYRIGQAGALNHCYYMLAHSSKYYLGFDVDEYLVNASRQPLITYLQKRLNAQTPGMLVPGFEVLRLDALVRNNILRAFELAGKETRFHHNKWIVSGEGIEEMHVHDFLTCADYLEHKRIVETKRLSYIFMCFFLKKIHAVHKNILTGCAWMAWGRLGVLKNKYFSKRQSSAQETGVKNKSPDLYVYNFQELGTLWLKEKDAKQKGSASKSQRGGVMDHLMQQAFQRAKFPRKYE